MTFPPSGVGREARLAEHADSALRALGVRDSSTLGETRRGRSRVEVSNHVVKATSRPPPDSAMRRRELSLFAFDEQLIAGVNARAPLPPFRRMEKAGIPASADKPLNQTTRVSTGYAYKQAKRYQGIVVDILREVLSRESSMRRHKRRTDNPYLFDPTMDRKSNARTTYPFRIRTDDLSCRTYYAAE